MAGWLAHRKGLGGEQMQRRVREQEGRDEDGDGDGNRHVEAGLESVQTKGEDEGEKTGEERGVRG